jgi:hypothetical protein
METVAAFFVKIFVNQKETFCNNYFYNFIKNYIGREYLSMQECTSLSHVSVNCHSLSTLVWFSQATVVLVTMLPLAPQASLQQIVYIVDNTQVTKGSAFSYSRWYFR